MVMRYLRRSKEAEGLRRDDVRSTGRSRQR
jgi:hypothetical protein